MKTKIIGVVSFKGGVGKTISAINIAAALTKRGKKVLIIDSNFLSPTLHVYSGLLDPDVTLKEVLFNGASIHDAIYRHESGIHIIPCLFCKEVNPRGFLENINKIKNHYDFIILDAGTSYNEEILPVFHASDELIFITTPDYPTLSTTSKIAEIALDKQKKVRGVLINRQRDKSFELTAKDIEYTLGLKVIAEIKDDNLVIKACSKFTPLVYYSPYNKNSRRYLKLASSLIKSAESENEEII